MIKSNTVRSILLLLAAGLGLGAATMLSACNTIEGAGEDVESAGQGVSGAAEQTQEEIFYD